MRLSWKGPLTRAGGYRFWILPGTISTEALGVLTVQEVDKVVDYVCSGPNADYGPYQRVGAPAELLPGRFYGSSNWPVIGIGVVHGA